MVKTGYLFTKGEFSFLRQMVYFTFQASLWLGKNHVIELWPTTDLEEKDNVSLQSWPMKA